jgi:hypothetical protein
VGRSSSEHMGERIARREYGLLLSVYTGPGGIMLCYLSGLLYGHVGHICRSLSLGAPYLSSDAHLLLFFCYCIQRPGAVAQTVLRSDMTLTMLPCPATSTTFSCQLSSTLIACPPPSPPPLCDICEKPVACGDMFRELVAWPCDMPLYLSKAVSGAN